MGSRPTNHQSLIPGFIRQSPATSYQSLFLTSHETRATNHSFQSSVRVIYYWLKADDQIFLLTLYGTSDKDDLSAAELKRIVKLIEELK